MATELQEISKKILAIMREVGHLEKDGKNTFQNYDYVSEAGAVAAVRKAMIANGVIAWPNVLELREAQGFGKDGKQILTSLLIEYTFLDVDSGQSITFTMAGQGMDAQDKGIYKAFTGCNKYALMKLLQIPTGDDDPEKSNPGEKSKGSSSSKSTTTKKPGSSSGYLATENQKKALFAIKNRLDPDSPLFEKIQKATMNEELSFDEAGDLIGEANRTK